MTELNVQIKNKNGDLLYPKTKAAVVFNNSNESLGTVEAGAEVNTIEEVQVNGVALTPDSNRAVNVVIPETQVNSDWNAVSGVAQILNKPTLGTMAAETASDYTKTSELATVAMSGSYTDLSNKPTIPTATSDLTNDSGYITDSSLAGYATESWIEQQGYLTGVTSSDVNTALGYTPYDSSNPSNYQENVIETVKVNGTALTPTDKAVDIIVPSAITESTVSGWGFTKNVGTVTSVNNIQPVDGNVTISAGGSYSAGTGIDITNEVISVDGQQASHVTLSNVATSGSYNDLSDTPDLSSYQQSSTAVTHTENTPVGSSVQPVYIESDGTATAISYKFWVGTQTEYDGIQTKDSSTIYFIKAS